MADTAKLRKMINDFEFWSKPSNGNSSAPATVEDINKLIKNVAKVLNGFIDELEHS